MTPNENSIRRVEEYLKGFLINLLEAPNNYLTEIYEEEGITHTPLPKIEFTVSIHSFNGRKIESQLVRLLDQVTGAIDQPYLCFTAWWQLYKLGLVQIQDFDEFARESIECDVDERTEDVIDLILDNPVKYQDLITHSKWLPTGKEQ